MVGGVCSTLLLCLASLTTVGARYLEAAGHRQGSRPEPCEQGSTLLSARQSRVAPQQPSVVCRGSSALRRLRGGESEEKIEGDCIGIDLGTT